MIVMQQPELGRRLTALRKAKNLTQEELVEKSHVSVRTIQRIEAGEVLPRTITIKILLEALGETYESFSTEQNQVMETTKNTVPHGHRTTLLIAVVAGVAYLIIEIILGAMDIAWILGTRDWDFRMNTVYVSLVFFAVASLALFARGFIVLSNLFENSLLKVASWLLILVTAAEAILDVNSLSVQDIETLGIPYAAAAVIIGVVTVVFGVALIRLQDSMGELSRMAGLLEIVMGSLLITVVFFFIAYVVFIPAMIVQILVLYRGYEYLSKLPESIAAAE